MQDNNGMLKQLLDQQKTLNDRQYIMNGQLQSIIIRLDQLPCKDHGKALEQLKRNDRRVGLYAAIISAAVWAALTWFQARGLL